MGLVPESLSSLRTLARHLRWIALTERLVRIGDGKAVNAHGLLDGPNYWIVARSERSESWRPDSGTWLRRSTCTVLASFSLEIGRAMYNFSAFRVFWLSIFLFF